MTDYTKLKNADLEAKLKERNLPHSGKKADLVARLVDDDKARAKDSNPQPASAPSKPQPASAPTKPQASAPTKPAEDDNIDWDDTHDAAPTPAAAVTADAAAVVAAAGGQARASNPVAVPNQIPAVDPSTTHDLTVASGTAADDASAANTTTKAAPAPAEAQAPTATPTPTPAFTSNLAPTVPEDELAKRAARAAKFGIVNPAAPEADGPAKKGDEVSKAEQRAKRFGLAAAAGDKVVGEAKVEVVRGLDEALPERQQGRKRARVEKEGVAKSAGGGVEGGRNGDAKRRRGGGAVGAGRGNGVAEAKVPAGPAKTKAAGSGGYSEADRAKAEARKNRFAMPSS